MIIVYVATIIIMFLCTRPHLPHNAVGCSFGRSPKMRVRKARRTCSFGDEFHIKTKSDKI